MQKLNSRSGASFNLSTRHEGTETPKTNWRESLSHCFNLSTRHEGTETLWARCYCKAILASTYRPDMRVLKLRMGKIVRSKKAASTYRPDMRVLKPTCKTWTMPGRCASTYRPDMRVLKHGKLSPCGQSGLLQPIDPT